MIKQRSFDDSQGIKFFILFFFYFILFSEIGFWCVCGLGKNFSPDILGVNLEVLKLLHLFMDCHEVCFKWWSKRVFMILRRLIFEFHFSSYAWMSLTCSRSFPRGVACGYSRKPRQVSSLFDITTIWLAILFSVLLKGPIHATFFARVDWTIT